jgi:hypothetical protein
LANSVTWPARVAMLSARWARLEVLGIIRTCGSRARSQARPTWAGVASRAVAAASTAGCSVTLATPRKRRAEGKYTPGQVVLPAQVEEELARAVEEAVGVLAMRL